MSGTSVDIFNNNLGFQARQMMINFDLADACGAFTTCSTRGSI